MCPLGFYKACIYDTSQAGNLSIEGLPHLVYNTQIVLEPIEQFQMIMSTTAD